MYIKPINYRVCTFPKSSFKNNCRDFFVCYTCDKMTYFKLGIIECIHYHIPLKSGHIVDGIVQIHECHNDVFWSGVARFGGQLQATVHGFILGKDDCHFSMYFVNKSRVITCQVKMKM